MKSGLQIKRSLKLSFDQTKLQQQTYIALLLNLQTGAFSSQNYKWQYCHYYKKP